MSAPPFQISPADRWREHAAATLRLGMPLIGIHLAQIAITTTDTIMIGWLGAPELAAGVLGSHAFFLILMLGSGFAHAILPVASQAAGRGDATRVRRSIRMGLWIAIGYSALAMPGLWWLEAILIAAGQDPAVSALAGDYIRIMQWSLFPATLLLVLRSFLVSLESPQLLLWNTIGVAVLNAILNYVLMFGLWGSPAFGIRGAAIASVIASSLGLAVVVFYATLGRRFRRYAILRRFWLPDWPAFAELLRLGWPISLTVVAEVGLFSLSSVMMGWLGTVQLAAHGIALQLISIAFMVPLGLAGAATVRVGRAFGRGDPANLQRAARMALFISVGVATVSALVFWIFPYEVAALFLDRDDPDAAEVLGFAAVFLAVAAAFQIADNLQAVAIGILRGLKDTRTPMLMAVIAYWVIGMPTALLLGFAFGLGGWGIWLGLACGLAVACVLLLRRAHRMMPRA